MNEAFCFAKAYFMVRFFDQTPEKHCPVWNIHSRKPLSYRRFVLDFAFCILHFAFRSQTDKPKFEILPPAKNPDRHKTCRGPFLIGEYHSTRRLYSDTLVSVMTNSTPPSIIGQSTTAYWEPSIQTDTQEGAVSIRKMWKSLEVKKKWSR